MKIETFNKAAKLRESIEYLNERIRWFMPFFENKDHVTDIVIHCEKSESFHLALTKKEFLSVLTAIDKNLHDQVSRLERQFAAIEEPSPVGFGEDFVLEVKDREAFIKICEASTFDFENCEVTYKLKSNDEPEEVSRLYNLGEVKGFAMLGDLEYITLCRIEIGAKVHRIPTIQLTI